MKKVIALSIVCLVAFVGSMAWAESEIPRLVGTWNGKGEAGVLIKGKKTSPITHHDTEFSIFKGKLVIQVQKGRVFKGYLESKKATEKIYGVIGYDNKTFYYVDTDGFNDGKIVTPDKLQVIYHHIKPTDCVIAVATYTRQK